MTIDSAATATPTTTVPAQRGALPTTRPLPVIAAGEAAPGASWQVYAAVAAGLLGGALMVAGVLLPW